MVAGYFAALACHIGVVIMINIQALRKTACGCEVCREIRDGAAEELKTLREDNCIQLATINAVYEALGISDRKTVERLLKEIRGLKKYG